MTESKRILLVMASAHRRKGGPSTAVREMAEALVKAGHEVTVTSHDDSLTSGGDVENVRGVEYHRFKLTLPRFQYSRSYGQWLRRNAQRYDLAVVHSLFLPHTRQASRALRNASVPFALRPHGSLNSADLSKKRVLKTFYLKTLDRVALKSAAFLFCTSQQEAEAAARWSRTVTIPLGANAPALPPLPRVAKQYDAVFIGRITAKKGVDIFVDSITSLHGTNPERRFLIAGPDDEGLLKHRAGAIASLIAHGALEITGHISADEREIVLRNAELFVLPSADENFGIAVAEALAASVPVVITPGVSHSIVVADAGGGRVVERSPRGVSQGIEDIWALSDEEYAVVADQAATIAKERYSWENSAKLLVESFAPKASKS